MLSRPIASGAMLVVLLGAMGGAILQQGEAAPEAGVADIDVADTTPEPERPATPANRVVETAGFPVVPEAEPEEEEEAPEEPSGPVVTVNGRPLGGSSSTAPAQTAPAVTPGTPAQRPASSTPSTPATPAAAPEQTEVAVVPPPTPQPRPAGLTAPASPAPQPSAAQPAPQPVIDYEAIAEAAYGSDDYISEERRRALAPIPNPPGNAAARNPVQDELVGVVGPNGEVIWVYEEQVRPNSGVTIQNRPASNPFGFIYDAVPNGW